MSGPEVVGTECVATPGTFTGGEGTLTVTTTIQKKSPSGSWENAASPGTLKYTLKEADYGYVVRARSTAKDQHDPQQSLTTTSPNVGPVVGAPINVHNVVISGTAKVGQKLTGSHDAEGGISPFKFTYLWKDQAGNLLKEAAPNENQWTIPASAEGKRIILVANVEDSVGQQGTATSPSPTAEVEPVEPPMPSFSQQPANVQEVLANATLALSVTAGGPVPSDITYDWKVRNGGGTITGQNGGTATYNAPSEAPGSASVTCEVASNKGNSNANAGTWTINISEEPPAPES